MRILTKRVYEAPTRTDGYRVLVDRLWPRGISKSNAALDEWCKELAPSDELRKWFSHDPDKWAEFSRRYTRELNAKKDQVNALLNRTHARTITLLYAAKDAEHNNAMVLKRYIDSHLSAQAA